MEPILLKDSATGSTARIAAHLGFNCYEFHAVVEDKTIDVIDSAPDFIEGKQRCSGSGIPILFPYPNRIRNGMYQWDGEGFEISSSDAPYDNTGNAIHGFCLDRPWRVVDKSDQHVVGRFQLSVDAPDRLPYWPGDCAIQIRYELRRATLHSEIRISNPGQKSIPWGFGTHPYFKLPLGVDSQPKRCLIVAPAAEEWELVDCLPTKARKPISSEKDLREGAYFAQMKLDDALTGLKPTDDMLECLIIDEQAGLQIALRFDTRFRELVVYTPPGRDAVCLEPYTSLTDAINLQQEGIDAGLRVLEPGQEFTTWIQIEAGLVIV